MAGRLYMSETLSISASSFPLVRSALILSQYEIVLALCGVEVTGPLFCGMRGRGVIHFLCSHCYGLWLAGH